MKLVDISKCHEDSPDFTASLSQLEEATNLLEKRLKNIVALGLEREALNAKDRELTQKLIREFEVIGSSNLLIPEEHVSTTSNCVEVITTGLKQLVDIQERMFEQLNLGIVGPLQHFLTHDLEQVKASRREFTKAHSDTLQLTEKLGQCKKNELASMTETALPLQLFESRSSLHKATCQYTMELNSLHAKGTPDFLCRIVDFMMFYLSYFRLGRITTEDSEPHATALYTLIEKLRKKVQAEERSEHSKSMALMKEVGQTRLQRLLHFYSKDLQVPLESAKSTIRQHLSSSKAGQMLDSYPLDLPVRATSPPATPPATKAGYMWYAEPRTFGTHWIRLYFYIKNGMLLSESTKVKVPISLALNLCNAKPAEVNDTERNFAFKVTSPMRVLLLQCESSLELQDWLETINNAISCAITAASGQSSSTSSEGGRTNGSVPAKTGDDSDRTPVKPPRRKSHSVKDLFVIPGNEICADCGANKPRWASVNLGVLVCIECSGAHRSLGVYVSQVRSLTLDSLKPSSIRHLRSIGNTKSNATYEALLPKDFDKSALRKANGENRQDFIMEKYVTMKYTTPEDKERILVERQAARAESLKKSNMSKLPVPQGETTSLSSSQLVTSSEDAAGKNELRKAASFEGLARKKEPAGETKKSANAGQEGLVMTVSDGEVEGSKSLGGNTDKNPPVGNSPGNDKAASEQDSKQTDNHNAANVS